MAKAKADSKPSKTEQSAAPAFDTGKALLHSYITNEKVNQFLLATLPSAAWRAEPASGRTIAAIVAHMHNVRVMWLKVAAKDSKIPEQLDRHTVTVPQAKKALKQS